MEWSDPETFRATCVHEAGHAVIARVLGYDVACVSVAPDLKLGHLGVVRTRGVESRGLHLRPPHAVFCLAGLVAEERVRRDSWVLDFVYSHAVEGVELVALSDDLTSSSVDGEEDLAAAWIAVGRDWDALTTALDRAYAAVQAAWRRIDAVARLIERVGTVDDGGNFYGFGRTDRLHAMLDGRGTRWRQRAHEAIHGQQRKTKKREG